MTKHICDGMAYVMLSRCSNLENVFLAEDFEIKHIHCSPTGLQEKLKLDDRCIIPSIRERKFDIYYVNCMDISKTILDIQNDIDVRQSDLICLTETWVDPKNPVHWNGKTFNHASYGNGKGVVTYYPSNHNT